MLEPDPQVRVAAPNATAQIAAVRGAALATRPSSSQDPDDCRHFGDYAKYLDRRLLEFRSAFEVGHCTLPKAPRTFASFRAAYPFGLRFQTSGFLPSARIRAGKWVVDAALGRWPPPHPAEVTPSGLLLNPDGTYTVVSSRSGAHAGIPVDLLVEQMKQDIRQALETYRGVHYLRRGGGEVHAWRIEVRCVVLCYEPGAAAEWYHPVLMDFGREYAAARLGGAEVEIAFAFPRLD